MIYPAETLGATFARFALAPSSVDARISNSDVHVNRAGDDACTSSFVIFLETAELRTKSRQEIRMAFWQQNVGQIITSNGFPLLANAGSIGHAQMESNTEALYQGFDQRRKQQEALRADQQDDAELKALESALRNRPASHPKP